MIITFSFLLACLLGDLLSLSLSFSLPRDHITRCKIWARGPDDVALNGSASLQVPADALVPAQALLCRAQRRDGRTATRAASSQRAQWAPATAPLPRLLLRELGLEVLLRARCRCAPCAPDQRALLTKTKTNGRQSAELHCAESCGGCGLRCQKGLLHHDLSTLDPFRSPRSAKWSSFRLRLGP